MTNETKYEDLALDFFKGQENLLNKFEEVTGKLEDFEETLNDALERLAERQYTRDNHELLRLIISLCLAPDGEIEVIPNLIK